MNRVTGFTKFCGIPISEAKTIIEAYKAGRVIVLPSVSERDKRQFTDGLHDVFKEWAVRDTSVGLFGMTDGEKALADAIMCVLKEDEHNG